MEEERALTGSEALLYQQEATSRKQLEQEQLPVCLPDIRPHPGPSHCPGPREDPLRSLLQHSPPCNINVF